MTKDCNTITMTERDYLLKRVGSLEAQVAVYREWLMSLDAIKPPKIINFGEDEL